ncbi:hypothetical protein GGX14DRAFT_397531 [Mycena pura]|uniref:Uncharacterized protein n=1 Tax=Mycena pura TaxID=153505 RepID=A0AAD6VCD2_9AGAR|nr:hypothetical protein GGX14DRAFT_397531 [Mycena pura]
MPRTSVPPLHTPTCEQLAKMSPFKTYWHADVFGSNGIATGDLQTEYHDRRPLPSCSPLCTPLIPPPTAPAVAPPLILPFKNFRISELQDIPVFCLLLKKLQQKKSEWLWSWSRGSVVRNTYTDHYLIVCTASRRRDARRHRADGGRRMAGGRRDGRWVQHGRQMAGGGRQNRWQQRAVGRRWGPGSGLA